MVAVVKSAMGAINLGFAVRAILLTGGAHPLLILANAPMVFRAGLVGRPDETVPLTAIYL